MVARVLGVLVVGVVSLVVIAAAEAQPVRVSVATDGTEANGGSLLPSMSATGRFVAFVSAATNLVAGDTNGVDDVFLRDRDVDADGVFDEPDAVATARVSQRGATQGNGHSGMPVLTPDGRYVVFESQATNLFAQGQPPSFGQIFRWDRLTGAIVLVSQDAAGEPLNARSASAAVTDDGNIVYFVTYATNVPAADVGAGGLVVRRDLSQSGVTVVSEPQPAASSPNLQIRVERPSVSGDDRVLVYTVGSLSQGAFFGGIRIRERGTAERTVFGSSGHVSHDGRFVVGLGLGRLHLASGESVGRNDGSLGFEAFASPSGRYLQYNGVLWDAQYSSDIGLTWSTRVAFDRGDTMTAYTVGGFTPGRQFTDVLVQNLSELFDRDADGLLDHWESAFQLQYGDATGADGASGDPDGDGLTNAQEFARGSSPTGAIRRYLAEGSSSAGFFTTRYAIANAAGFDTRVAIRFDRDGGPSVTRVIPIRGFARVTLDSHAEGLDGSSFAMTLESGRELAVDRLMYWTPEGRYGSHAERASQGPQTAWYLAEGSTVLGFQLFYLLQNPQTTPTTATITFILPSGPPLVRTYELPAQSRTTVYVNDVPSLGATDVSARISATQPIAVERAMYRSAAGQPFALGHAAAAVPTPATGWFFAEGATGSFFDTYLLLANPSAQPATVRVDYLRDTGGAVTRTYAVGANARFSIYVDGEPGMAATSFGIRVTSDVAVVAERAMYWAGGFFDYYEGHVSAGATTTSGHWLLAEGEVGGGLDPSTFVLIANTASAPATVRVRTVPTGFSDPSHDSGLITIPPQARVTLPLASFAGPGRQGVDVSEEGTTTGALIVEGAIYWNAGGVPFAAGASWLGTPVP
jgi:hypothetical protein